MVKNKVKKTKFIKNVIEKYLLHGSGILEEFRSEKLKSPKKTSIIPSKYLISFVFFQSEFREGIEIFSKFQEYRPEIQTASAIHMFL